ncbi:MAG: RNA polymerase sigma factor [Chloroflexi bacterium]|nr:RNA polymerase sigma factor [Chloroflexota bacterium]MCI0578498.1 RNA polymerase sigma factor [Chloroflexota bacterium]MCI0648485.1 RNA polymerase sigma factor [Chloroflexota bacterium]MCI0726009.1 RNA polymerase sigma factor [Chloroflexota bacterium]
MDDTLASQRFSQLYVESYAQLYRFFFAHVQHTETAEDLTSETFFRAHRRWPPHNLNGHAPKAWLFQIARNLLTDHYRASGRRDDEPLDDDETLPSPQPTPGSGRHLDALAVKIAFTSLSNQDQAVLSLRLAGLSNREIASTLDMNEGAAAMACLRALERLQKKLES